MTDNMTPGAATPLPGALPAIQDNGHWKDAAKWSMGVILALVAFIVTAIFYPRITSLEARQIETEKKMERLDQKVDDVKGGVDRIEKKLDR
jgi:membrane protein insertase Oxa1/YidC/SpoIIIJ